MPPALLARELALQMDQTNLLLALQTVQERMSHANGTAPVKSDQSRHEGTIHAQVTQGLCAQMPYKQQLKTYLRAFTC